MSDVIAAEDSQEIQDLGSGSQKFPRCGSDGPVSEHARRMARLYRAQARIFDLTRAPILLGRAGLARYLRPNSVVLEVGCGTGRNLRSIRAAVGPGGRVIGVECAPTMAARARRRAGPGIEVIQSEYGSECDHSTIGDLDAIVFSYSLSMIPHFERILRQVRRDLKPGGRLIILDFADSRWAWMRSWMRRFGVELGDARADFASEMFRCLTRERSSAWRGLWENYLLVAERR